MARAPYRRRQSANGNRKTSLAIFGLAAIAIGLAVFGNPEGTSVSAVMAAMPGSGCDIKGNVSKNSSARIYHVPGQKFYDATIIRPEYGERWFCSEAEAQQAGWRPARR